MKAPTIKTNGTVTRARIVNDTLRMLLRPASGKDVIAIGKVPRCPLGKLKRPRKGSGVEVHGTLSSEGLDTVVITNCTISLEVKNA